MGVGWRVIGFISFEGLGLGFISFGFRVGFKKGVQTKQRVRLDLRLAGGVIRGGDG